MALANLSIVNKLVFWGSNFKFVHHFKKYSAKTIKLTGKTGVDTKASFKQLNFFFKLNNEFKIAEI